MAVRLFSSSVIWNTTNQFPINTTKTQRWIFGVIIGSAPFLLIVICWILGSFCINNSIKYYQYFKKRRRYTRRKYVNKNIIQTDTV